MRCSPTNPVKRFPWMRLALVAVLILLSSSWTCAVFFVSCQGVPQPQITSLSPEAISSDTESTLLTVAGNGFTPQSQIMWNANALPTTVMDSQHLQTTITQQTFESFGGSAGSSVQISSMSKGNLASTGCPIDGSSNVLLLVIN
jgi:hypothetical protein